MCKVGADFVFLPGDRVLIDPVALSEPFTRAVRWEGAVIGHVPNSSRVQVVRDGCAAAQEFDRAYLHYIPKKGDVVLLKSLFNEGGARFAPYLGHEGVVTERSQHVVFVRFAGSAVVLSPYDYNLLLVRRRADEAVQEKPAERVEESRTLLETCSADIVLADGTEVSLPDPDPSQWELKERTPFRPISEAVVVCDVKAWSYNADVRQGGLRLLKGCVTHRVYHEKGMCWLKDMAERVNRSLVTSPFEVRFAYVKELRVWVERANVVKARYSGCESILSCLW